MKRKFKTILAVLTIFMTSCNYFDNSLYKEEFKVDYDYSDNTHIKMNSPNTTGLKMYDKDMQNKEVKKLIGGDILEFYYQDENKEKVDHILVNKSKIIKVYITSKPGTVGDSFNIYPKDDPVEENRIFFDNAIKPYYIINKDGSALYIPKRQNITILEAYASYQEKDIIETSTNVFKYTALCIYSYNPR